MNKLIHIGQFLGRLIIIITYLCLASIYGKLHAAYIVLCCIGVLFSSIASDFMINHNGKARVIVFLIGFAFVIIPSFIQNITLLHVKTSFYQETFFLFCALWEFIVWITCGGKDTSYLHVELWALGGVTIYVLAIHFIITNENFFQSILYFIGGLVILFIMLIKRLKNGSALMY